MIVRSNVGAAVGDIVGSILGDVVVGDALGSWTIITTILSIEDSPLRLVLSSCPYVIG